MSFTGAGTCVIDANQAGNGSYNAAPQVQQSFAVGKGSQTISYTSTAPAAAVVGGATYHVTATGGASGNAVTFTIDAAASAVCSISASTVSFTAAGTCVIDANQVSSANYNAAPQAQQSFAVGKGSQTISFPAIATQTYSNGGTFALAATASSGLTVSFASTTPGVCTVSGTAATMVAAGSCTITANQSGNGNYNAAPQVSQNVTIGKASQAITYTSTAPVGAKVGGATYSVAATGGASGNAVTFAIDAAASSVCSIAGSTVSFIGAGTCVIDASQAGNANYNAAPQAQQSFAVGKGNQSITFTTTAPANAMAHGPTYTVAATASSGLPVTLTIDASASSVCALSGSAVSFTSIGTCVIDANQAGSGAYNPAPQAQQSFNVTVGPATQLVFTTQPFDVAAGNNLGTIAVTQKDAYGNTVSSSDTVSFAVSACGGSTNLGSAPLVNGVSTLSSGQRFYTIATGLQIAASSSSLNGTSQGFMS
ncbi:hypothetical protein GCM10009105_06640 [Dokdonella soli]|uniref:MBG domain-containing protein n=1 Tax=Dokdonella soli TaxID=529810 RepID=A0ABP3TJP7_9GAMM